MKQNKNTTQHSAFDLLISSVKTSVENILTERKNYATLRPKMLEILKILNVNIVIMDREKETLTYKWANSTERVSKNIDNYPVEYLRKYEVIRTAFRNGLDDLKNTADQFLTQPRVIYRQYALNIYRQYLAERMAQRTNVAENLLAAERNILEVSALKYEFEQKYLPAYNEAKSYLRKIRQELRELASSTRTDARDLKIVVEHLEESNSSVFFKIFINRMKNKRIDPLEILKEAREKYDSAVKTFENTNSFIATKIRESGRGQNFEKTLKVFIEILTEEIELITVWTKSAKVVSSNIENNSEEILREFQSVRNIFINGLDDLKQATETFLAQPRDIIKL